jgi:hypothetical protein
MSNPVLEKDKSYKGVGTVLTSIGSGWIRPTGVFLPDFEFTSHRNVITVLLWFHGWWVKDIPHLFYQDDTKILPAVLQSKRHIVLVAPHLGWHASDSSDFSAAALSGKTEKYLDQVLAALYDWYKSGLIDIDLDKYPPPRFQISDLYLAGHSGGGDAIRNSVASLGAYKDTLRECWGFDCLYGKGASWAEWARSQGGMPLYFYFGQGTSPAKNGDVLGFWKRVYGTPKSPLSLGSRMLNVYLAPALPGTALDTIAFQFSEDIKAKRAPGNRYEEVRRKVDPLLDDPGSYWSTIIAEGLFDHYPVVSALLGPRISQSIL